MKRLLLALTLLVMVRTAAAQSEDVPVPPPPATKAEGTGAFLPSAIPAAVGPGGTMVAYSGVDGRSSGPAFTLGADLHLLGPVALRGGVTYMPGRADQVFQPNVGARVQLARQSSLGVDVGLGVFWRREIITADEGLFEGAISVARSAGRLAGFAHVAFGMDDEGDDREGEVSLGGLLSVGEHTRIGVDARLRVDLFSTDQRRAARAEPDLDLRVGPTASVTLGQFALLAQVGYAGVRKEALRFQSGLLALGGLGLAF